jgi:hypothetical protein
VNSAGSCDSCGAPDDRREAVHRVYLDLDEFGELWGTKVMPEAEWWCPACRVTYPNEPITSDRPVVLDEPATPDDR